MASENMNLLLKNALLYSSWFFHKPRSIRGPLFCDISIALQDKLACLDITKRRHIDLPVCSGRFVLALFSTPHSSRPTVSHVEFLRTTRRSTYPRLRLSPSTPLMYLLDMDMWRTKGQSGSLMMKHTQSDRRDTRVLVLSANSFKM